MSNFTADGSAGTNDTRRDDLVKEVTSLGAEAALGKDSLPKLAHRVVRAAADGVVGTGKDSDKRDDAAKLYEDYVKGASKKAIHEHTDGGVKAQVSKLRKLIEMGSMTIIDPVDVMNRAHAVRQKLQEAGVDLKPAYASYVDLAREQLDSPGAALDDAAIEGVVSKAPPKEKTVEKELEAIHRRVEKLVTGEGGLKHQTPELIQAEELLRTALAALMVASEQTQLQTLAAKHGVALTPATAPTSTTVQ
jgi:hypothetical protein